MPKPTQHTRTVRTPQDVNVVRVKPTPAQDRAVRAIARKEKRSINNTMRLLLSEALESRGFIVDDLHNFAV